MQAGKRLERAVGVIRQGAFGPVLICDGGGEWELDYSRQVMKHLGRRVEILGIRSGFNDLVCKQIFAEGQRPENTLSRALETWIVAVFMAYGLYATIASYFV